jgi:hypothetical protein
VSNIRIIFSNLDNHSNSCFIYFLADAVPEGIEQTGYLFEFTFDTLRQSNSPSVKTIVLPPSRQFC